jgi:DNA-binding IclR family transcriptional regulator
MGSLGGKMASARGRTITRKSQQLESAGRLIDILMFFAERSSCSCTVKELAESFDLPLSTTYRYVSVLKDAEFIRETHVGYRLGARCSMLEAAYQTQLQSDTRFRPFMHQLAKATNETVIFVVPAQDYTVCIDVVDSRLALRFVALRGKKFDFLHAAPAKCMLPYLDAALPFQLLQQDTSLSDMKKDELLNEIEDIRQNGYAVSVGDVTHGLWSVSAPIFTSTGVVEGSISTIVPEFRLARRREILIEQTKKAADSISSYVSTA